MFTDKPNSADQLVAFVDSAALPDISQILRQRVLADRYLFISGLLFAEDLAQVV